MLSVPLPWMKLTIFLAAYRACSGGSVTEKALRMVLIHWPKAFHAFSLSVPLATLLDERGASGRLHQKLTREMERTYASCTGIPLLLRRASSLSLALSLREESTRVCDMRRSRDCLHHSLKEASLWASALAAASLRLRARDAASEGVGEGLGQAVTFSFGNSTVPGATTSSPPSSLPASMLARLRLFLPLHAPCGMPVESRWGLPSIPGHALARAFTCPTKTASS